MAQLTMTGYMAGSSLLHRLDPRCKIVGLMVLTATSLQIHAGALALISICAATALWRMQIPIRRMFQEMRHIAWLLLLVAGGQALSTPGAPLWRIAGITLTREGAASGAIMSWRLCLMVVFSLAFVSSTRPGEIRSAITWLLKPIPFVPEKRVGTMISLMVRFLPHILHHAEETLNAMRSRGFERRRNPVRRLILPAIPLIRRIFSDADQLAVAMAARGYRESRSERPLRIRRQDWAVLLLLVSLCAALLYLSHGAHFQALTADTRVFISF